LPISPDAISLIITAGWAGKKTDCPGRRWLSGALKWCGVCEKRGMCTNEILRLTREGQSPSSTKVKRFGRTVPFSYFKPSPVRHRSLPPPVAEAGRRSVGNCKKRQKAATMQASRGRCPVGADEVTRRSASPLLRKQDLTFIGAQPIHSPRKRKKTRPFRPRFRFTRRKNNCSAKPSSGGPSARTLRLYAPRSEAGAGLYAAKRSGCGHSPLI